MTLEKFSNALEEAKVYDNADLLYLIDKKVKELNKKRKRLKTDDERLTTSEIDIFIDNIWGAAEKKGYIGGPNWIKTLFDPKDIKVK